MKPVDDIIGRAIIDLLSKNVLVNNERNVDTEIIYQLGKRMYQPLYVKNDWFIHLVNINIKESL